MSILHVAGTRQHCQNQKEKLTALGYQCDRLLKLTDGFYSLQYWWEGFTYDDAVNFLNGAKIGLTAKDICPHHRLQPVLKLSVHLVHGGVKQDLWSWHYNPTNFANEEEVELVKNAKLHEWKYIHPEYAGVLTAEASYHQLIDLIKRAQCKETIHS